jgi:hypothetical protein
VRRIIKKAERSTVRSATPPYSGAQHSRSLAMLATIRRAGESFYAMFVQLSAKLFDKGAGD